MKHYKKDPAKLRPAVICRFRTAVLFPKGFPLLAKKTASPFIFSVHTWTAKNTMFFGLPVNQTIQKKKKIHNIIMNRQKIIQEGNTMFYVRQID